MGFFVSTLTLIPTWVQSLIGWGGGSSRTLCIFNPLGHREGGVDLGTCFCFPNGEHGLGSYQDPGVSPEMLRPGYK